MTIRPVAGRWRLSEGDADSWSHTRGRELWESATPEGCRRIAALVRDHERAYAEWAERASGTIRKGCHIEGIEIQVSKSAGSGAVQGRAVETSSGKRVASLDARYTGFLGTYVLGEPTINCSAILTPGYTGQGLARVVMDAMEEVAGLPLVPHGHRHVGGSESAMAMRFWGKRAEERRVPGFDDPSVDARMAEVDSASALISAERTMLDPYVAMHLALALGHRMEGHVTTDEGGPLCIAGWVVLPDGRALTTHGPQDREGVCKAVIDELFEDGSDTGIHTVSPAEAFRMSATYGRDGEADVAMATTLFEHARKAAALIADRHLDIVLPEVGTPDCDAVTDLSP